MIDGLAQDGWIIHVDSHLRSDQVNSVLNLFQIGHLNGPDQSWNR